MNFSQCRPYFEQEILRLDKEAEGFGLHPLLGQEIEFEENLTHINKPAAEALREEEISFVKDQIAGADGEKRIELIQREEAIRTFSPHDLLMFYLHDMDDKTRDYLMPAFGADEYRDHPEVCELRLKPLPPAEWIKANNAITRELKKIAASLGTHAEPQLHVSISLSDANGNIFALEHPEYPYLAGKAVEGITRAVYDAAGLLAEPGKERFPDMVSCLPSRTASILRVAKERIELRETGHGADYDASARAYILLSGTLYGVMRERYDKNRTLNGNRSILPYQIGRKPIFAESLDIEHPVHLKRLLGGSLLDNAGRLQLDNNYLIRHIAEIRHEINNMPDAHLLPASMVIPQRFQHLSEQMHILKGKDKDSILFAHHISPSMPDYQDVTQIVNFLNRHLPVESIIEIPIVDPGYRNVKASEVSAYQSGYRNPDVSTALYTLRFRQSPVFTRTTDPNKPDAFEAISQAHLDTYGSPLDEDQKYDRELEKDNARDLSARSVSSISH